MGKNVQKQGNPDEKQEKREKTENKKKRDKTNINGRKQTKTG